MQLNPTNDSRSLDRHRSYLLLVARCQWNPRLQGKLDPSDAVQQTLVQAWQGLGEFRGQSEAELRAWLRQILNRCLVDMARHGAAAKRNAAKERSLDVLVTESSS